MSNILTVTFSPCLDKSFSVPSLLPASKLRCSNPVVEPGGGGINVSRAIKKLGGDSIAIYPIGGYSGKHFHAMLRKEAVRGLAIHCVEPTRENIVAYEESTQQQFRFIMPSPALTPSEWKQLLSEIERSAKPGFLIVSGSLPPESPVGLFRHLSAIARKKKAKLVVDTSEEGLVKAVREGLFLIKPNLKELAHLSGKDTLKSNEVPAAARKILAQTRCEIIIVSMGAAGACLVTKDLEEWITAPPVTCKSTVGAGDSMVAGIVVALSRGQRIEQAARYGVACGTAATLNSGTELCGKQDADTLYQSILTSMPSFDGIITPAKQRTNLGLKHP